MYLSRRSARRPRSVAVAAGLALGAVFATVLFGGAGVAQAASPNVPFADAALKACVLQTIGSSAAEVSLEQLQSIPQLECEGKGIVDIAPLAQATGLTTLRLSRNSISTVPSLAGLSLLKKLELSQNEIVDLSGLAGLGELQNLDVRYNRLQGIAVLRGLGRLQTIDASFNSIGSLGDLSTLNDLDYLNVSHNSISSAAAFAGGIVLREANLSFNLLTNAQFSSRLTQLSKLDLSNNALASAVPMGLLKAEVVMKNQTVQLPAIAVDVVQSLPVIRGVTLDALRTTPAAESQAWGSETAQGFVWRSNGVGQLMWEDVNTRPAGNVVSFSGWFTQVVTRGTLTVPVPTISGTAVSGQTLTAMPGAWGPAPVALSYQWKRGGTNIAGATASTYRLTPSDIGAKISVVVNGYKPSYATANSASAPTVTVAPGTLTATPVPAIAGTAKVAQTLTASAGTWAPAPVALAYQWNRDGAAIAGATASTYTLVNADAGAVVTVTVTGSKPGYATVSKTSVATTKVTGGVIVPVTPKIVGSIVLGKVLTVTTGDWTPAPVSFVYHWKRGGVLIAGATAATYTVTAADVGKSITVQVDGSKPGFAPVVRTSAPAALPK